MKLFPACLPSPPYLINQLHFISFMKHGNMKIHINIFNLYLKFNWHIVCLVYGTVLWKMRHHNTWIILRKKFWHTHCLVCLYIRVFSWLQDGTLEKYWLEDIQYSEMLGYIWDRSSNLCIHGLPPPSLFLFIFSKILRKAAVYVELWIL